MTFLIAGLAGAVFIILSVLRLIKMRDGRSRPISSAEGEDWSDGLSRERVEEAKALIERHLEQGKAILLHFGKRKDPEELKKAIEACEKQITLSGDTAEAYRIVYARAPLPPHLGYLKLAAIREEQKDFDGLIALCRKAALEGWAGDWRQIIIRAGRKGSN